jgi:hypothetical protein
MSDESTAPVAAESAPTPAPTGPLTQNAAAKLLEGDWIFDDDPEETPASDEAPDASDDAEPAPEGEAGEEPAEADAEAEPGEKPEPEAEESDAFVHGNARTRLRDGTVVPVSELKKGYDELKGFRARTAQIQAAEQQIRAQAQRLVQQEQLFNQVLPLAAQIAQEKLPTAPDPKLATEDPIEHYQQTIKYNAEMGRLQQLQQARQAQMAQANMVAQANAQRNIVESRARLIDTMPELKRPERLKEFQQDFVKYGNEIYGYSAQELNNVVDHRVMPVIRDAIAWRKHLASQSTKKTIAESKAKTAVPVATPARRASSTDSSEASWKAGLQKLRDSGGDVRVAAKLLENF